jgi:hypothetical protein
MEVPMTRALPVALALLALAPAPALACGGFFCSQVPIDQSKERIVFGIDEEAEQVDVHVQIFYQGDARDFSWVVPVPTVPDVLLSSDQLFQNLEWQTAPRFWLSWETKGTCDGGGPFPPVSEDDGAPGVGGGIPEAGGGGVDVLKSGQTGPYDWVVVAAAEPEALLAWLADPDGNPATDDAYVIPPTIGPKLAPYLADGAKFVAFKLQSDAEVGDIAPVRLSYAGTEASIPLVLTSIAATPDMRLQPYVFASKRAVPDNYLHVVINEAAINWISGGSNYDAVVTEAANEAGGQAFATDYFGSTSGFRGALWSEDRFDVDALAATSDPVAWVNLLLGMGLRGDATLLSLFREFLPMPEAALAEGLDERSFYNCLGCWPEYAAAIDFDPVAATAALAERVIAPLRDAEALYTDHPFVTRLTSSMSPEEMDADPLFVLNPDMTTPVLNTHEAKLVTDCTETTTWADAPRWIELADGRIVEVPPESWFWADSSRYESWIGETGQPAAIAIEDTSDRGQPVPVADASGEAGEALEGYNDWVRGLTGRGDDGDETLVTGCAGGCSGSGAPVGAWAGLLVGLALVRRRR